jgi:hypothetical protein
MAKTRAHFKRKKRCWNNPSKDIEIGIKKKCKLCHRFVKDIVLHMRAKHKERKK